MTNPNEQESNQATKQILVFEIDQEEYAVDIIELKEISSIVDITPIPNAPDYIEGISNLRGEIIVVINIEKKFNLQSNKEKKHKNIIIAKKEDTTFGILVDSVKNVEKISEDQIQETPELSQSKIHTDYLKGVVVMGKRLLILIDLLKILSIEELKNIPTPNTSQNEQ